MQSFCVSGFYVPIFLPFELFLLFLSLFVSSLMGFSFLIEDVFGKRDDDVAQHVVVHPIHMS